LVLTDRGEIKEVINKPFESNNTFKLKYEKLLIGNDYHDINPNEWKKIKSNDDFPDGVSSIFYKIAFFLMK
jgi:hypothetical protein